jgi:hypothetical protein
VRATSAHGATARSRRPGNAPNASDLWVSTRANSPSTALSVLDPCRDTIWPPVVGDAPFVPLGIRCARRNPSRRTGARIDEPSHCGRHLIARRTGRTHHRQRRDHDRPGTGGARRTGQEGCHAPPRGPARQRVRPDIGAGAPGRGRAPSLRRQIGACRHIYLRDPAGHRMVGPPHRARVRHDGDCGRWRERKRRGAPRQLGCGSVGGGDGPIDRTPHHRSRRRAGRLGRLAARA